MADQQEHPDHERSSSSDFTGEAADKLRNAEDEAAAQPEQPEEEDDKT